MLRSIDSLRSPHLLPWHQALSRYERTVFLCGLLALAAAMGGCRRGQTWNLVPIEGTVTKGGRPLSGIQVVFLADLDAGTQGPRASGITDEAGHYRLRTDNGDDGAVTGKHRVLVLDAEAQKGPLSRTPGGPQREATRLSPENAKRPKEQRKSATEASRVPPSYGNFNETSLRVKVRPGEQIIDLEVK